MNISNNYVIQLFSKSKFPFVGMKNKGNTSNAKAIEDLLSGRRKNSYGVEGMRITGRTDWKKTVDVSDEMKQHVLDNVKKEFYKYGGMSGNNTNETNAYYNKIHSYIKTLNTNERSSATWTLSQLHLDIARAVKNAVKVKMPEWTSGQKIPSDVLDEIFADESITSIVTEKSTGIKELDMEI